jgi:hypothetical protein
MTGGYASKNDGGPFGSGVKCICSLQNNAPVHIERLYTWKKRRKTRKASKVTYKFQHQIALAWILSGSDASCQSTKSVHTISAIDSECTLSFSKAKKVSDASLDPNNGSLCI